MSSKHATGCIVRRDGARGSVLYAKVRVDGKQQMIRLGKLWPKRSRPPGGYLTPDQANARLQAILEGDDPQVNIAPSGVTFGRAVDEWLADRERELRPSTMHDYRSTAKRLRDFFGDSTPVEDVGVNRVNAFREHLLDGTDDAKGVSARTTNKT